MKPNRENAEELTHIEDKGRSFVPKVLMVGQEEFVRTLIEREIGARGYEIQTCRNPDEALSLLEHNYYFIVFSEIGLAGEKKAADILAFLRANYQSTKFVAIADQNEIEAAVGLAKAGAYDFLTKPIELKKFHFLVGDVLNDKKDNYQTILLYPPAGYKVVREIGAGSICKVLLVEKNGQPFAMKVFQRNTYRLEYIKRFFREASVLAGIKHPNVVGIYEYGLSENSEIPYIVMEYVQGRTLKAMIEKSPPDLKQCFGIFKQLAEALNVVHGHGVLHRDMKPHNVVVTADGVCKLIDFGIARVADSNLTMTNTLLGSPAYMAPEGFESVNEMDERSDLFSLGVVMYEAYTGKRPFYGAGLNRLIETIRVKPPPDPLKYTPNLPHEIREVLGKLLEKKPGDRYQNTGELLKDLYDIEKYQYTLKSENQSLISRLVGRSRNWSDEKEEHA